MKATATNIKGFDQSVQYAGFKQRLTAFGYDYLFIALYILFLVFLGTYVNHTLGSLDQIFPVFDSPAAKDVLAFFTLVFPVILYFAFQECAPYQLTWGKYKAGIRVVNAEGEQLSFLQAFLRSCLKFLPWQIAHTCIFHVQASAENASSALYIAGFGLVYLLAGAYILSAVISAQNRTLYDFVSGTYVILVKETEQC